MGLDTFKVAKEARTFHDSPAGAPVSEYLWDQLLVPLELGGGGEFRATTWSLHAESQREVMRRLLGTDVHVTRSSYDVTVEVAPPPSA